MIKKLIEKLFPKEKKEVEVEKEVEVVPELEEVPKPKLDVRVDSLRNMDDVDRITPFIKKGDILFLKIKGLQMKDLGLFQNVLQKMKRISLQFKSNLVAVEEGYLIVTPQNIKIEK